MANKFNDKNNFKQVKSGSSSSRIDFLKGGMDFLDNELKDNSDDENLTLEELNDPEMAIEIDQEESQDIEEIIEESPVKTKSTIVKSNIISKKPVVKKPDLVDKMVDKDVNQLTRNLVKGVSSEDIKSIINVSKKQKEQMVTGNMSFLARDNVTQEEKKEFLDKLDQITSSEDVSTANASFVMKWLKNRK